jgi:pyruvate,water dikinase
MSGVLAFEDGGCAEVADAGGKAASLARMTALGLPVPRGFVVTAGALRQALEAHGSLDRLQRVLSGDDHAAMAADARALVLETPVPDELARAIGDAYAALGPEPPVAVRSSACSEDSTEASFAGQQDTYLHVRGAGEVVARVRDCWGSFFAEHALVYRSRKGSLDDLAMAVAVQVMVEPEVAGVLFTIDPTRGRRDQMIVEAVFGLGEAVVSGEVTPDHYVLARDGRVKTARITTQPYAVVRDENGGVRHETLREDRGGARTLEDEQLARLASVGRDLEERLGGPQDIEWAFAGGELYVLQSRPVTA